MSQKKFSKPTALQELDILYQQAIHRDQLSIAFKVIELKSKLLGWLPSPQEKNSWPTLQELSDQEIDALLVRWGQEDPEIRPKKVKK